MVYDEEAYRSMFFAKYWQLKKLDTLQSDTNPNLKFDKALDAFLSSYNVDHIANLLHCDIALTTCDGWVITKVKSDDTVNFECITCAIKFDLTLKIDLVSNDSVIHDDFSQSSF